jgi:hypothetical protein
VLQQLGLFDVRSGTVQNNDVPKSFMTAEEARERLGFKHVQSIYDAIEEGRLEGFVDDRRMWWISEDSVNRFQRRKRGRPSRKSG